MKIILMTNTARIPNVTAKEIAPFFDVVMVTIHADNAAQHDKVTKIECSYVDLISTMKEFQSNGVEVEVAFNITPKTFNQITSSIDALFLQEVKINRFILQRIAPVMDNEGLIILSNEQYIPKKSQINIAMAQIEEVKENYGIPVELVDPFPLCVVDEKYHKLITPCKCGLTDLSINGNGAVSRCGADPNYKLGNILSASHENHVVSLWEHSHELSHFRGKQYLPEQCQSCSLKVKCGGGCASRCNVFRMQDRSHLDIFEENQEFEAVEAVSN